MKTVTRASLSLSVLMLAFAPSLSGAAVNFFDPRDTAAVPKLLSQTGVYTNMSSKSVDTALKYFEVNAALWSDAAHKQRWIVLPPGKQVVYNDTTDYLGFPDSTFFVKNFLHDSIDGNPASRVYWETRLLVNRRNGQGFDDWYGFSYKWNAAGTEAYLVDLQSGFDTVFYTAAPQGYRKWRYPSQLDCGACHLRGTFETMDGPVPIRGVLGFFPVQLKRPMAGPSSINQVDSLFNLGVFSGDRPDAGQLAGRWRGIQEPISPGLTPEERFWTLDTMARAYLAANCSGCHGTRQFDASGARRSLNFDFHHFTPRQELAEVGDGAVQMEIQAGDPMNLQDDGFKFVLSAVRAGLDTSAGSIWNLSLPAGAGVENYPAAVYPGYPSFSVLLYRQLAMRKAPWRDSLAMRFQLDVADPEGWSSWIFSQPWGSQAWRGLLASHNVPIEAVISPAFESGQMPLLATYIPDTAAMKVLGEWMKTYRSGTVTGVRAGGRSIVRTEKAGAGPRLQNGILIVPADWSGPVRMAGLTGKTYTLQSAGRGRYVIPGTVPAGVYFFKMGARTFRASLLR